MAFGRVQPTVDLAGWPSASAVVAVIILTLVTPEELLPLPSSVIWLVPLIEGSLLIALIVGDPGEISRRSRLLRVLTIGLVALLVLGTLTSTGFLIASLIDGGSPVDSAGELLATGAVVWAGNNISFLIRSLFAPFPVGVGREGSAASGERARRSSLLLVRSSSNG